MKCSKCPARMATGDRFCGECGQPASTSVAEPAPESAASADPAPTSDTATLTVDSVIAGRPAARWSAPLLLSLAGSMLVLGSIVMPWQYQELQGVISVANDLRGDTLAYLLAICAVTGAVAIAVISQTERRRRWPWVSFVPVLTGVACAALVLVDWALTSGSGLVGTFQTSHGKYINQLGPGPLLAIAGGVGAAMGAACEVRRSRRGN